MGYGLDDGVGGWGGYVPNPSSCAAARAAAAAAFSSSVFSASVSFHVSMGFSAMFLPSSVARLGWGGWVGELDGGGGGRGSLNELL